MPKPKRVLNAFTVDEVVAITGLSRPMADYLARMEFLRPAYDGEGKVRGRVRYYSYRDLVVARVVQRLRENGVQLSRLKDAIRNLGTDKTWSGADEGPASLGWLVTDGRRVYVESSDGFLDEVGPGGQRAFGFVVSLQRVSEEVRERIPVGKLLHFSMQNAPIQFDLVAAGS